MTLTSESFFSIYNNFLPQSRELKVFINWHCCRDIVKKWKVLLNCSQIVIKYSSEWPLTVMGAFIYSSLRNNGFQL